MTAANTPIVTFQDILDALAQNPELKEEMRRHLQDEAVRNLPQTVAQIAQNIQELTATVQAMADRQDRTEDRQDRMEGRLDRMEERQTRMEGDIAELKDGQVRMEERQTRTEERQTRMEGDIVELKDGQTEMRADIDELKQGQVRMQGTLNRLSGTDYERRIARSLRRNSQRYFGISGAQLIYSITLPNNNPLPDLLDQACDAGTITPEEARQAESVDLVIIGHNDDGSVCYAVIEASINVDQSDVTRAQSRSQIIARASGNDARPAVAGDTIPDAVQQYAAAEGVATIVIPED